MTCSLHTKMFFRGALLLVALMTLLSTAHLSSAAVDAPGEHEPCRVKGAPPPLPAAIGVEKVFEGLNDPVHVTHGNDGSNRLYIVEQAGTIRIAKDGALLPTPFLDIGDRVKSGGERGLLSAAFHPGYSKNGRLFVNYTSARGGLHTVVSEFRSKEGGNTVDRESERILLEVAQPYSNHNGGQIAFGPDGYLYIGMGDGGSGNDPRGHGQDLSTLLGTILRIDVDGKGEGGNRAYALPDDNPFRGRAGARPEIWAYGLRNPWRFSFDAVTGTLYAGDVGQSAREEVDIIEKGGNYGWRIMEGRICTPGINRACSRAGLVPPLIDYGREEGISVIGGAVYRGNDLPALCGAYLYGDWGSGKIWALRHRDGTVTDRKLLLDTDLFISSFGTDEEHELYITDHKGAVYRIDAVKQ